MGARGPKSGIENDPREKQIAKDLKNDLPRKEIEQKYGYKRDAIRRYMQSAAYAVMSSLADPNSYKTVEDLANARLERQKNERKTRANKRARIDQSAPEPAQRARIASGKARNVSDWPPDDPYEQSLENGSTLDVPVEARDGIYRIRQSLYHRAQDEIKNGRAADAAVIAAVHLKYAEAEIESRREVSEGDPDIDAIRERTAQIVALTKVREAASGGLV